jgi:hypothetical protein
MTAATREFPANLMRAASVSFHLQTRVQTSSTTLVPITMRRGVMSSVWVASITFATMDEDLWRELSAFISSLDGQRHFLTIYDPSRTKARGAGLVFDNSYQLDFGGNPYGFTFNGNSYGLTFTSTRLTLDTAAARGADTVTVKGLVPSTTGALKADDMFEIGGNLHRVLFDANSDADGKATVDIRPRLRKPHAANDGLNFKDARGRFILGDAQGYDQTVEPPLLVRGATLTLIEAPDVGVVY